MAVRARSLVGHDGLCKSGIRNIGGTCAAGRVRRWAAGRARAVVVHVPQFGSRPSRSLMSRVQYTQSPARQPSPLPSTIRTTMPDPPLPSPSSVSSASSCLVLPAATRRTGLVFSLMARWISKTSVFYARWCWEVLVLTLFRVVVTAVVVVRGGCERRRRRAGWGMGVDRT